MKKCEMCSRALDPDEEKLCPACKSEKSHKEKRMIEYGAGGASIILGIIWWLLGGSGGGKRA